MKRQIKQGAPLASSEAGTLVFCLKGYGTTGGKPGLYACVLNSAQGRKTWRRVAFDVSPEAFSSVTVRRQDGKPAGLQNNSPTGLINAMNTMAASPEAESEYVGTRVLVTIAQSTGRRYVQLLVDKVSDKSSGGTGVVSATRTTREGRSSPTAPKQGRLREDGWYEFLFPLDELGSGGVTRSLSDIKSGRPGNTMVFTVNAGSPMEASVEVNLD